MLVHPISSDTPFNCTVGLELGVLLFVSMTNCGVPEDSFSSLLGLMGVGGVRSLTFKEGHGTIQPYHLQNLSSLAHLGNTPHPTHFYVCTYIIFPPLFSQPFCCTFYRNFKF